MRLNAICLLLNEQNDKNVFVILISRNSNNLLPENASTNILFQLFQRQLFSLIFRFSFSLRICRYLKWYCSFRCCDERQRKKKPIRTKQHSTEHTLKYIVILNCECSMCMTFSFVLLPFLRDIISFESLC